MEHAPPISIIVLAYGAEAHLGACVTAICESIDSVGRPLDFELIVVDNGADRAVDRLPEDPRIRVIRPARNLGFAGGCNAGAKAAVGQRFVFVNSDAIVEAQAVQALCRASDETDVGIVSGSVRLADRPELMNTAGNPVHFLGVVWAGSFGEPWQLHVAGTDIASATGALFAVTAKTWALLDGFDEQYFAYHEDVDLSLRAWQRGLRVRFEPAAIAWHYYAFSRNRTKQYLLERNRWITLLTVFPPLALAVAAPVVPIFEILVCAVATKQGWLPDKLRSYGWLIRHQRYLRERRKNVQRASTLSGRDFLGLLSSQIEPTGLDRPPGLTVLNRTLDRYWKVVLRLCRAQPHQGSTGTDPSDKVPIRRPG